MAIDTTLIINLFQSYGLLGLILGFMLLSLLTVFLPVPIDLVTIYAVEKGFNPILIILVASIGTTLAGCVDYLIGRVGSIFFIKRIKKETFDKTYRWLERWGFLAVFFTSFIPSPFEVVAITVGLLKMNFHKFFLATLLGKLLKYSLFVYLGTFILTLIGLSL